MCSGVESHSAYIIYNKMKHDKYVLYIILCKMFFKINKEMLFWYNK